MMFMTPVPSCVRSDDGSESNQRDIVGNETHQVLSSEESSHNIVNNQITPEPIHPIPK